MVPESIPGGAVVILISAALMLASLHYLWPKLVEAGIRRSPVTGGEKVGEKVWVVGGFWIVLIYALLLVSNPDWDWRDTEPAISAVVATVAIMYGYGQTMPAPSYVAFYGDDGKTRVKEQSVTALSPTLVTVVVHNTGIAAWKLFRVTVEVDETSGIHFFESSNVKETGEEPPVTTHKNLVIPKGRNQATIELPLLVVGEPGLCHLYVLGTLEGTYTVRVRIASDIRPGEHHDNSLKITVKEPVEET